MKIMIFRIGYLGDTVLALPAFHAIRQHYCKDEIFLLSPRNPSVFVNPADVLVGTGLVDGVVEYPLNAKGLEKVWDLFLLKRRIEKLRPNLLIYLPPSSRKKAQIERDEKFFSFCGIKKTLGLKDFSELETRDIQGKIKRLPRETDFLLERLKKMNIPIQNAFEGLFDLFVHEKEKQAVDRVLSRMTGQNLVAFCVGGKTQAQKWPIEKYQELGRQLGLRYNFEPVLFGSQSDSADSEALISFWGRGLNLCGKLTIHEAAEALRRCVLYIGNDTGPMHLAALAGTACVAIFSSRSNPGLWEPFGGNHRVIRKEVPCAGCELEVCNVPGHPCLTTLEVEEVFAAASKYLGKA